MLASGSVDPSVLACLGCAAALAAAAPPAASEAPFASSIDGVELRPEVGTGIYGYHLTGNLGVTSFSVRLLDTRWLLSWDGAAELTLGAVAYEHPYYAVYGAQANGEAEGGLRLAPAAPLSAYVAASLGAGASAITQSGVPLDGGAAGNNLGSFGGPLGHANLRPGFGLSYLDAKQSLVAEAQLLGELDSPQADLPAAGYFGGALHLRYDLKDSLAAIGDLSYAATPSFSNPALGTETSLGRWTLAAEAVKTLGRGFFAGLGISVGRTATTIAFTGGPSYVSAAPLDSRIWLLLGYWP